MGVLDAMSLGSDVVAMWYERVNDIFTNFNHVPTTLIEFERILQDVVRTSWSTPEFEGGFSE